MVSSPSQLVVFSVSFLSFGLCLRLLLQPVLERTPLAETGTNNSPIRSQNHPTGRGGAPVCDSRDRDRVWWRGMAPRQDGIAGTVNGFSIPPPVQGEESGLRPDDGLPSEAGVLFVVDVVRLAIVGFDNSPVRGVMNGSDGFLRNPPGVNTGTLPAAIRRLVVSVLMHLDQHDSLPSCPPHVVPTPPSQSLRTNASPSRISLHSVISPPRE